MKIKLTAVCSSGIRLWLQLHSLWEQKGLLQQLRHQKTFYPDGKDLTFSIIFRHHSPETPGRTRQLRMISNGWQTGDLILSGCRWPIQGIFHSTVQKT